MVVDELYRREYNEVSSSFSFSPDVIEKALRNIYSKEFNAMTDIEQNIFSEFWAKMWEATDIGIANSGNAYEHVTSDFYYELQNNNAVFSAFKSHRMGVDMAKLLTDSNGNLLTFEQWYKLAKPIADHQIYNWGKTEYNTAIRRAHIAADWKKFEAEADVLPNLEWMPSTAVEPRAEHIPFYGLILPIDHPFWKKVMPGDEWGCQCDLAATDAERTPEDEIPPHSNYKPSKGLENNPADGKIFNDTHPYFASSCKNCKFFAGSNNKPIAMFFGIKKKDCYECPYILEKLPIKAMQEWRELYMKLLQDENYTDVVFNPSNGGLMATHIGHNFDKKTGVFETNVQKAGYKTGHTVVLEMEDHTKQNIRNTEGLWDGYHFEVAGATTATVNNIRNALKHCASKKKTDIAILYFKENMFNVDNFKEGLKKYYGLEKNKDGQYLNFKQIICVQEDEIVYMIK